MPKQTFKSGNQAARGKGRPVGSRTKFPQWLKDLVVLAAELSGYPRITWVQATNPKGKRLFKMRDKLNTNGKPIKDKYGKIKRERSLDENGTPIPIMKEQRVFEGEGGALGYLLYIAQTYPQDYGGLLKHCLQGKVPFDTEVDQNDRPTLPEELRAELERRGLPIEYFRAEMGARRLRAKSMGTENKDEDLGKNDRPPS